MKCRCKWVNLKNDPYITYHDEEWGVPVHDDRHLFEMLILEGAQAGLSWETVLNKRENYRAAFEGFDPVIVAGFNDEKIDALLNDEGIVRNRLKVTSAVRNAGVFLEIQKDFGSFDAYLWAYVNGVQIDSGRAEIGEVPATSDLSDRISKDLKKRGMNFVGSTIIYSFLQAVGVVNDHTRDCFRYDEIRNGN
jgi:DNA-3-methyladenine glycosylase I